MKFPALVLQIINILNLVTLASPEVAKLYERAKELFNTLFAGGIITAEQQAALIAWADRHEEATLAGEVPPELTVEEDPK